MLLDPNKQTYIDKTSEHRYWYDTMQGLKSTRPHSNTYTYVLIIKLSVCSTTCRAGRHLHRHFALWPTICTKRSYHDHHFFCRGGGGGGGHPHKKRLCIRCSHKSMNLSKNSTLYHKLYHGNSHVK